MNKLEDDIPKHRKKKESSTSKAKSKSKHKHEYVECLLITGSDKRPHRASYCKICGKIDNVAFFETEKTEYETYRVLDADEVLERYKDLEKIYVDGIWQKYVPISKGGE